jgi:hypothetical protein
MVKFDGVVIADDGALVTTDALSFFNKGDRALTALGVCTLFASLAIQGGADSQRLLFATLPQLVSARHAVTSACRSP